MLKWQINKNIEIFNVFSINLITMINCSTCLCVLKSSLIPKVIAPDFSNTDCTFSKEKIQLVER